MIKKPAPKQDPYEILEVSKRASPEVISAAYRALMMQYHPDKGADDDTMARALNAAKEILLDPAKRSDYDCERHNLSGKVVGNYRILNQIAEGGFGKTYLAEHIALGVPVCLKHGHKVSPKYDQILKDEARAIWDLRHYGIPNLRDYFTMDDGTPIIVMSYVPGKNLEQIVQAAKRIPPEHVAWITERSLNVLKYLHYNGVVHGDVKPQNIIVDGNHMLTLVDYGLSMIRPDYKSENKGYTPFFAAPEQLSGGTLLPETDFYGLGMTMIYALGGDVERVRVPSCVPDEMCRFIKRLIVRDVMARPNWSKEDLCQVWSDLRLNVFGRRNTNFEPLAGLEVK